MSSCQLMFPGVSFLVFSSFGFKPLPLAFSLILRVASTLLHPYSTDDKRLMVKILHSELGGEEKGEGGDRGDLGNKKESQKGRK